MAGVDLFLGGGGGRVTVVAGADGGVGHAGHNLPLQQGLGQLQRLGPGQAGADLGVAVDAGAASRHQQGAVGDGAFHQLAHRLGRDHAHERVGRNGAHFGRQDFGGGGQHVGQPNGFAFDTRQHRVLRQGGCGCGSGGGRHCDGGALGRR